MNKQTAALLSIFSNSGLVVLKVAAGLAMGSISVLSEAVHSAIDLLASVVAYFSIRKSNEPADSEHPYGHGKFENISGFFEAILIFVAAGLIAWKAVIKLAKPAEMDQLGWGMLVMLASVVVNVGVSRVLFRVARREHSIALEADAMHLSVDVWTSVGVFAGLVAIHFTGLHLLDPLVALGVAALILRAAWDLTRRALDDLADRSLPERELSVVEEVIGRYPEIRGYHRLRTRRSGKQREIDIHIKVAPEADVASAHELCNRVEGEIRAQLPGTYVLIHVEPSPPGAAPRA
ncbi:MAG: cation diffusion facilitator family transporter [Candidatus Latescibacterota bacterium]|jgi:cation diffusion facilitator family transporter